MALTQISTAGVKDDAVTSGKIPANAVGSSELADNAVDTAAIADSAITNAKINASAAIAGSKISPDFGSQNIVTTGSITGNDLEIDSGTLSVDASNNRVGIGTASPEITLSVDGGVAISSNSTTVTPSGYDLKIRSNTSKLGIHTDNSSGIPTLEFGIGNTNGAKIATSGAGALQIHTDSTERMRIHSSGLVTVGESGGSAYGGQMVVSTLTGGVLTCADLGSGERLRLEGGSGLGRIGTDSNHALTFITNGTSNERMRIDTSGNVGIGTSSPSQKLHLKDTAPMAQIESSSYSSYVGTAQANDNIGNGTKAGNLVLRGQTGVSIIGNNGTATQVKIDADGLKFNTDTAAANALDDYEEGTWSPTSTNGMGTIYSAFYTKVGRIVHVSFYVNAPTSSSSSAFYISNLPFAVAGHYAIGSCYTQMTSTTYVFLQANQNGSTMSLLKDIGNGVSFATLSGGYVLGSITYFTT